MIVYDLVCDFGHQFEGWFNDKDDYDMQLDTGLLDCPVCGSEHIAKVPSASRINLGKSDKQLDELTQIHKDATSLAQRISDYIKNNFEDVGHDLADEARKIYYGDSDERNIHGTTSLEEALELQEEGIDILPLPDLPDKDKLN